MIWIPIILSILVILFFAWKGLSEKSKANSLINFFQYGENFKEGSFFATLMASNSGLSASVYLILVYGYFYGIGVFPWVLSFWILTQVASVYTIKKVEKVAGKEGGFISENGTLHEFLGRIYDSKKVRVMAGLLSTITFIGLIAAGPVLGYEIFAAILPSGPEVMGFGLIPLLSLLGVALLVFYYTSRSGFRAVVATDKIQLVLILLMMAGVLGFIAYHYHDLAADYADYFFPLNTLNSVFNATGQGVLSFMFFFVFMNIIFWAVWWPSAMDQWHRVAATRNVKTALSKGFGTLSFGSVAYLALLTFTFLSAGSMVKVLVAPETGASSPLFYLLTGLTSGTSSLFGWLVIGLIVVGLIAVLVSTVDTYLVVAGQSVVSDIYLASQSKKTLAENDQTLPKEKQEELLRLSGKVILLLSLPIFFLFFVISQLADVFTSIYFAFSFMMAVIPALFIGLFEKHKKENANAAFWGLVLGGIWSLTTNLYLIFTINKMLGAELYNEVLLYYNMLYANPAMTAVIALVITLTLILKNKLSV